MTKKILLISGDPTSVNTEIIFKAWKKIKYNTKSKIYLISNHKLIKAQLKKLNYSLKIFKVDNINQQTKNDYLKLINVDVKFDSPYKISKKNRAVFVKNCLDKAHHLASKSTSIGIINCAIDKTLLSNKKIGVNSTGIGFHGAAPVAQSSAYTATTQNARNADTATADAAIQDVLQTLIADLKATGIIG